MSELHTAAAEGNIVALQALLNKPGYNVNDLDYARANYGMKVSPLDLAAEHGHLEVVKFLLTQGAHPDSRVTKLYEANHGNSASANQVKIFRAQSARHDSRERKLYELNKDNSSVTNRDTPLIYACREKHPQIVEILLEAGAEINARNEYGNTALHYVTDLTSAQILLQKGADANALNYKMDGQSNKQSPLTSILYNPHNRGDDSKMIGFVKLFIESGIRGEQNDQECFSAFDTRYRYAALNDREKLCERMLKTTIEVAELLKNPDLEKIMVASEGLADESEERWAFRQNFAARAKKGELDAIKFLDQCFLHPQINNDLISSIEKNLKPEQFYQFITENPTKNITIPQENQTDVRNSVVESFQQKGVPTTSSIPKFIDSISDNFTFLKEPLNKFKEKALNRQLEFMYHLGDVYLLSTGPITDIPEIDIGRKMFLISGSSGNFQEDSDEEMKLAKETIEKYQKDPSLFLDPILRVIGMAVKSTKINTQELPIEEQWKNYIEAYKAIRLHDTILFLYDDKNESKEDRQTDTPKDNKKLFNVLGTVAQVKELQKNLPLINNLYIQAQEVMSKFSEADHTTYRKIVDGTLSACADMRVKIKKNNELLATQNPLSPVRS